MATSTVSVLLNTTVKSSDTSIEFDVPWAPPSDISDSLSYLKVSNFIVDVTSGTTSKLQPFLYLLDTFVASVQNTSYESGSRGINPFIASYKAGDSTTPYPVLVQIPSGENVVRFRLRCANGTFLSTHTTDATLTVAFVMSVTRAKSRSAPL